METRCHLRIAALLGNMSTSGGSKFPIQPVGLSQDEAFLLRLIKEKAFQEIVVKVQDGVIISVERKEKFLRKRLGNAFDT